MIVFLSLNFCHGNVQPFVPWASAVKKLFFLSKPVSTFTVAINHWLLVDDPCALLRSLFVLFFFVSQASHEKKTSRSLRSLEMAPHHFLNDSLVLQPNAFSCFHTIYSTVMKTANKMQEKPALSSSNMFI